MLSHFQFGENRYQPDANYVYATNASVRVDQRKLAKLVGIVAIGLPLVMMFAGLFVTEFFNSISHFYYSQVWGDVFVGSLVFIGTFLIAYRGAHPSESLLATPAGFAAYGIAIFPTSDSGCTDCEFSGRTLTGVKVVALGGENNEVSIIPSKGLEAQFFELFDLAVYFHAASAVVLFAFMAYFSFFVFTRSVSYQRQSGSERATVKPEKKNRNRIYVCSGGLIAFSMFAIGANWLFEFSWWNDVDATFWFEALALTAFGISWMVKGRLLGFQMDEQDKQDALAAKSGSELPVAE